MNHRLITSPQLGRRHPLFLIARVCLSLTGKRSPTQTMYASATQAPIETKNPQVNLLVAKWQHVWLLALDRRRKLNDAMDRLEEVLAHAIEVCALFGDVAANVHGNPQLKEFANFDFDVWRKRYMRWMNHKKSRVMDFFRRIDKDQDGKVTRQEFIEGILSSSKSKLRTRRRGPASKILTSKPPPPSPPSQNSPPAVWR